MNGQRLSLEELQRKQLMFNARLLPKQTRQEADHIRTQEKRKTAKRVQKIKIVYKTTKARNPLVIPGYVEI